MSGVAWFVDGAYALECWKCVCPDHKMDYLRFREEVEDDASADVDVAYYFNSDEDPPNAGQSGFNQFLQRPPSQGPGFRVVLGSLQRKLLEWPISLGGGGPVVHPVSGRQFEQKSQKEVDVLLAFNLIRSFAKNGWKRLYLVAGDRDFFEVVKHLVENEGVELTIFGVKRGRSGYPSISAKYGPFGRAVYFEDLADKLKGPALREDYQVSKEEADA